MTKEVKSLKFSYKITFVMLFFFMYARGEVTDQWSEYLGLIVRRMGVGAEALEFEEDGSYKPLFGWVRKKLEED